LEGTQPSGIGHEIEEALGHGQKLGAARLGKIKELFVLK
jgi:hypothetical protein